MSELLDIAISTAFTMFIGDPAERNMRCVSAIVPVRQCIEDHGLANCNRVRAQARQQCADQHRADEYSACMFFASPRNAGVAHCEGLRRG